MTPRAWKRLFARTVLWAGIVVTAGLLSFLGFNTWTIYTKNEAAAKAHFDEADQLAELTAREKALSAKLDALGTSRGVEAEVRETYPLARSGEEVIVLTDTKSPTTSSSQSGWGPWRWFSSLFSW